MAVTDIALTKEEQRALYVINNYHLGQISKNHESGRKGVGNISSGKGDPGGVSYGSFVTNA